MAGKRIVGTFPKPIKKGPKVKWVRNPRPGLGRGKGGQPQAQGQPAPAQPPPGQQGWQAAPAQQPPAQQGGQAGGAQQVAPVANQNIIVIFVVVIIVLAVVAVAFSIIFPPNPSPGPGNGYCSSNADCSAFGNTHCGGTDTSAVECGTDSLCHCSYTYAGCTSDAGCDVNTYCDPSVGVCYFKRGGLTTD
jgi:hypothetical protein